jgi:c-di-GMP-binding flagellar brake protein YcgR
MAEKLIENRKYIRHPSDIPIEVSSEQPTGKEEDNLLHNISLGGVCFKSNVPFKKDEMVSIRISLVRPVFEARGSVVWSKENEDGSFDIGLEFSGTVDAFKARMVEQVCRIEQYKKEILEREGRALTGTQAAIEWINKYAKEFSEE